MPEVRGGVEEKMSSARSCETSRSDGPPLPQDGSANFSSRAILAPYVLTCQLFVSVILVCCVSVSTKHPWITQIKLNSWEGSRIAIRVVSTCLNFGMIPRPPIRSPLRFVNVGWNSRTMTSRGQRLVFSQHFRPMSRSSSLGRANSKISTVFGALMLLGVGSTAYGMYAL